MLIPKVEIQYAKHLDPFFKSLFQYNQEAGLISKEIKYPEADNIIQKADEYNQEWLSRAPVLEYLQKTLHLDFQQTIIDAYIIGKMKGAISAPILTSSQLPATKYIDILTHEIIHCLINSNKQNIHISEILPALYPDESTLCQVHIIVNAVMKKVYLEFLNEPQRLIDNKDRDKNSVDYNRAWEIVENTGENNIIEQFIGLYT